MNDSRTGREPAPYGHPEEPVLPTHAGTAPTPATRARGPLLVLVAAVLLLLPGCYAVQRPEAAPPRPDHPSDPVGDRAVEGGGDLVMGLSAEPDKLDPTTSSSLYTRYVMNTICEKLYDIDASGKVVPQLASALPEVSKDGKTVTIGVRDGVRFADGTPLDAEAVKTTLERNLTLKTSARKSELGPVASVEAPSAREVVVHYETPFAPLTAALADRAGMIMSPKALADLGDKFSEHPTCVGPFSFVSRVPQTSITVQRDPMYYAADQVHLDTITYRIMSDANIRAANLRSGDIQVADSISTQDVDALVKERDVGLLQTSSLGYQAMTINLANTDGAGEPPKQIDTPLASDPRVRLALAYAVDRGALVNSVFNNWYEPACSPIPPTSPYASPGGEACVPHDPAKARELLQQAGVPIPFPITVKTSNTAEALRYAAALQAALEPGGFAMRIEPVEYSTLLDQQTAGDFDAILLGWSGRIDPHGNMNSFLVTGGGNNYAGYSNEVVDDGMAEAARSTDTAERARIYAGVMEQVRKDNPIIYLYRVRNLAAYTSTVGGVEVFPDGVVRLSRAAFLREG
ncbi:ABC transporter substrate-binding protein [Microlunatus spumicola]|uniref:ABC transporter substrate-binding protein n=1 Tax=Microlunatus spumicola TaxID=81499 RepID=A0ABP6XT66_9ACTN